MLENFTPIKHRKVRFALIGCGRIAGKHFESFEEHDDRAELVAVCDTDDHALGKACDLTGAKGYSSLGDMLQDGGFDVVVITTPSGLHAEQGARIAAAGYHVLTEKPMATRWSDGKALVKACDRAGVHLFVVKQNRRNTTLQLLKRAMEKNVLAVSTWSTSMYSGRARKLIMTKLPGEALGSLTVAPL